MGIVFDPKLNLIGTPSDRIICRPYGARSAILPLILWVWRPYGAGEGQTARNSSSRDDPVISLMHHRIMSGRELVRSRLYLQPSQSKRVLSEAGPQSCKRTANRPSEIHADEPRSGGYDSGTCRMGIAFDPELNLIGTASDRITCRPYGARSVILPLILWAWRPSGAGEGRRT